MQNVRYHYKEIKTAIRKHVLADFFTASKYSFSPYRACEHGCRYCDGRAEKYHVGGEFDKDIIIRKNIPDLLKKEAEKLREKAFLCIGSGVSDAYQPIERETGIMRRCAEILGHHDLPVVLMTKSSLALRDLDLWSLINKRNKFLLMVSLATTNDIVREIFEPKASPVNERLEMIIKFKKAGCNVGVLAMPLLPYITETELHMSDLASAVKSAGVDFCMPGGLTLRPGVQKETFFDILQNKFPQYVKEYNSIYGENRMSGSSSGNWHEKVEPLYRQMITATEIPTVIPHHVYKGLVSLYEEVYLVLSHMKVACEYRSIDTKRLSAAINRYHTWVSEVRRPISRSRKRSFSEVDSMLVELCRNGKIGKQIGNEKLGAFLRRIVLERAEFNFTSLKLQ
ncbi:MAG: radical SAM protein [Chitinispirillia bacterium]|jgi:DNA repair photolyase